MNVFKSIGFWMLVVSVMLLFATIAGAQDATFLACPPEFAECHAKVQAPSSPGVDRVCMRKLGSTAVDAALCKNKTAPDLNGVLAGKTVSIQFPKAALGGDHVRYEVVACDDDLGLCSVPADKIAIAVDLGAPSFFDVLRKALGL